MVYTQTDARYLPQGYTPDNFDILCGRGKPAAKHPGNIIFMRLIQSSVKAYDNAGSRVEKTVVVTSIVSNLDDASMRFLKFDPETNRYLELSPDSAHAKVGHAIRDLLKQRKTKLNKSKKEEDRGSKNNSNSNSSSATQSIRNEKTPASPKPGASGSILPPVTNATSPSSSSRISAMFAAASFAASNNNKNKRKHPFAYFSPYDYARMLPQQQQQAYRHQQQQEYCLRQQQLQQQQQQQQQQQRQQQQQEQEQEQERAILQNIMQLPPAPPPTDSCYMPLGYVPNSYDILCGRGIPNSKHPGNIIFLQLIQSSVKEYDTAESRIEKTVVVSAVVTHLNDTGMRFLKYDPTSKRYLKLSSDSAHAKVGHAIRDLLKQEERKTKKNEESSSIYSNPAPTRTTTGGDQQSSTPAASSPTTAVPDTARSHASDKKPQQQQEEPQLRKPQHQQQPPPPLQHLPALTRPPRPPPQVLPEGYVPNNYDILCGRGKPSAKHPGNIVFMRLIQASVKQYVIAGSRVERTIVVSSIVSNIDASRMRFLKLNPETKRFAELDADSAHAKVGHAIRDLLKQEERKRNKSLKGEELSKRVTVGIGGKYKKRNKDNKDYNSSSSPTTTPGVGKSSSPSSSPSPPSKSPIARPGTISSTSSSSSSIPATVVPDMAGSSNSNNSISTTTKTTTTTANVGIPQQQQEVAIPQKTVRDNDDNDNVSGRDSDVEVDRIAGRRSAEPTDTGGGGNGLFLQLVWAALKSEKMICDSSSSGAEEG